jgi:hypothetical protein
VVSVGERSGEEEEEGSARKREEEVREEGLFFTLSPLFTKRERERNAPG